MTPPPPLSDPDLRSALASLPGWSVSSGKLRRVFRFRDFSEAFAFMTRSALEAEKVDHHPDWSNVYSTVTVDLVTHDAGAITSLDVALAGAMNRFAASPGAGPTGG